MEASRSHNNSATNCWTCRSSEGCHQGLRWYSLKVTKTADSTAELQTPLGLTSALKLCLELCGPFECLTLFCIVITVTAFSINCQTSFFKLLDMKVPNSKLNRSWNIITCHWVPTFLCKHSWPHWWQTLKEQTQTSLCICQVSSSYPCVFANSVEQKQSEKQLSTCRIWCSYVICYKLQVFSSDMI